MRILMTGLALMIAWATPARADIYEKRDEIQKALLKETLPKLRTVARRLSALSTVSVQNPEAKKAFATLEKMLADRRGPVLKTFVIDVVKRANELDNKLKSLNANSTEAFKEAVRGLHAGLKNDLGTIDEIDKVFKRYQDQLDEVGSGLIVFLVVKKDDSAVAYQKIECSQAYWKGNEKRLKEALALKYKPEKVSVKAGKASKDGGYIFYSYENKGKKKYSVGSFEKGSKYRGVEKYKDRLNYLAKYRGYQVIEKVAP